MVSKNRVKDIDRGYKEIVNQLSNIKGSYTKVGVQEGDKAADNVTDLAQVAAFNEFGTENIPSRPFMRNAYSNNLSKIENIVSQEYNDLLRRRKTASSALSFIGSWFTGVIQQEITNGNFVPNAPSTIRQKGSSNPLIDTGILRQSIRNVEILND